MLAGVLLAGLWMAPDPGSAQQDAGQEEPGSLMGDTRLSVRLGLGAGAVPGVTRGLASLFEAVLGHAAHRVAYRSLALDPVMRPPQEPSFTERGVLYGRAAHGEWAHASLSAGVSRLRVCTGSFGSSTPDDCHRRWGVPFVAEGGIHAGPVGFGMQAFANVNRESVYRGLTLYLRLGWP